jgi:hypothetical protein
MEVKSNEKASIFLLGIYPMFLNTFSRPGCRVFVGKYFSGFGLVTSAVIDNEDY